MKTLLLASLLLYPTACFAQVKEEDYVVNSIPIETVSPGLRETFKKNKPHAIELERRLRNSGVWEKKIILAVLSNAWNESRFDPNCRYREGNGSISEGILQMNSRGAGRHLTSEQRRSINETSYTLFNMSSYKEWLSSCRKNIDHWDVGEMAHRFASNVLVCATRHREERRSTASRWGSRTNR